MYYVSTRNKERRFTSAAAILQGLAPDGGLITPEVFPKLSVNALETMSDMGYQQRAVYIMKQYLDDFSVSEMMGHCAKAYGNGKFENDQPAPVVTVDANTSVLELWHGPTCAFKDMALQMLPQLMVAALEKVDEKKRPVILVATSGDTGSAALAGFADLEPTKILVYYPEKGVSEVQQLQMTTREGGNVAVCAIEGNFDQAQSGVKAIFGDKELQRELAEQGYFLSSANSINWGRLLPQMVYYISSYIDMVKSGTITSGEEINVCVPTGNFGNILAAYYAKACGVPIGKLICASNANNVLTDFIKTGVYDRNRPFHVTSSPSMDILISSNLERLLFAFSDWNSAEVGKYMNVLAEHGRYEVSNTVKKRLDSQFYAGCCDDAGTSACMKRLFEEKKYLADPHTAVAFDVLEQYRAATGDMTQTLVVSTASPYKFAEAVLEALGEEKVSGVAGLEKLSQVTGTAIPASLQGLGDKIIRFTDVVGAEKLGEPLMKLLGR